MENSDLNNTSIETHNYLFKRNVKTETSNLEGSFRPCLFSRIDSNSSFESSFENESRILPEFITEQRPLSKPSSILKAFLLTDDKKSPKFQDSQPNREFKFDEKTLNKDFSKDFSIDLNQKLSVFKNKSEIISLNDTNFSSTKPDIEKIPEKSKEKEDYEYKFLSFSKIIMKKEEQIKALESQISIIEKELSQFKNSNEKLIKVIEKLETENFSLSENSKKLMDRLQKCENQLTSARNYNMELQKDSVKVPQKAISEDRVRKISESLSQHNTEKIIKDLKSDNEYLKQELQKRPSLSDYHKKIEKIEELENFLTKKTNFKGNTQDSFIVKSLMELLNVNNPNEILEKIRPNDEKRTENREKKLIKRISGLVKECVPPRTFKSEPTHREIWKFIRDIMEKYLILKKKDSSILVDKIKGCLGIDENQNILEVVLKMQKRLNRIEILNDKIKAKFGLAQNCKLKEIEIAVEEF